jgi:hypothetical protein
MYMFTSMGIAIAIHVLIALAVGSYVVFEGIIPAPFFESDFVDTNSQTELIEEVPVLMEEEPLPQAQTTEVQTVEEAGGSSDSPDMSDLITVTTATASPSFSMPTTVGNPGVITGNLLGGSGSGSGTGAGKGKVKMNFFGREMLGDNVLFVIDISGSMIFPERGLDGFEKVADEVISTIEQMNENRFNIIGFSKEADSCFDDFVRADRRSIQKAENWLRKMDPQKAVAKGKNSVGPSDFMGYEDNRHLGTRADLALELAFEKRPGLIIFLSDGDPTVTPAPKVLELTEELLKKHEVAINTISYRSKEGQKFLESLAELSGGTYTELK